MNDQLGARTVVKPKQLEYFGPNLHTGEGIVLGQVHIVLNEFHNQENSRGDLVGFAVYDDVVSDDSEIADRASVLEKASVFLHVIHQEAGIDQLRGIVADCMVFVPPQVQRLPSNEEMQGVVVKSRYLGRDPGLVVKRLLQLVFYDKTMSSVQVRQNFRLLC